MRVTVKRLRRWILMTAGLLLVVVAGFFFYGRNRFRHIEKDLPGRLGINIQQTATGFSYSQSSQGHTLFTLKASKLVQLKAGHALLHDVDITLYGPPGSGRTDRIYGSDFDYDQNQQIATSQGEVNIELAGTSAPSSGAPQNAAPASDNMIRVRTSGLTFAQKTGEAWTAQLAEFQLPRAAGNSIGANYNSKTGVLVLDSQVRMTTSSNGKSALVQAAHATLLRTSMQALLVNATMDYETEKGSSDEATVYFRKDGTTEKVDAKGHVHMATDTGETVTSDTAHILMDAKSQPTQADLGGGVQFASNRDDAAMHGSASEGTLLFAAASGPNGGTQTELRHGQFRQDVSFVSEVTGLAKDPHGRAEKELHAQKVDVDFGPAIQGHSVEAKKAFAEGSPVVTMRQTPSKGPSQTTRISGDHLVATLDPGNLLRQLDGTGNTQVLDEASDGSRDTTRGDVLHATFMQQPVPVQKAAAASAQAAPAGPRKGSSKAKDEGPKMETALETAIQDGNVVLTDTPASHATTPKPGASSEKPSPATQPATMTGWAHHAEYHAADQVLHLTGNPRIADGETMQMLADRIDYHRDSQNASANGNVKATYTQQQQSGSAASQNAAPSLGGSGPVHILAERASMDHASNVSTFYGSLRAPARMWQDTNSLLAPVIAIDRNRNLLKAWGENTGKDPVVNANLTSAMGVKHEQSVVRVHSQTLVYSDKDRQGDFHGTVTADQGNETIRSDDALFFLKPAPAPAPAKSGGEGAKKVETAIAPAGAKQSSQIDHMVATGNVVVLQPGRKGEGEKLVYTADDGKYVLTGTPAAQPRLWDRVHGTTTGTALIFNSQDDSVEVSGGKSSAVTETRAPK